MYYVVFYSVRVFVTFFKYCICVFDSILEISNFQWVHIFIWFFVGYLGYNWWGFYNIFQIIKYVILFLLDYLGGTKLN